MEPSKNRRLFLAVAEVKQKVILLSRSHAPRGNERWRRSASRPAPTRHSFRTQSVQACVPTRSAWEREDLGEARYATRRNNVTRPGSTHSTTKMLPSRSKHAS